MAQFIKPGDDRIVFLEPSTEFQKFDLCVDTGIPLAEENLLQFTGYEFAGSCLEVDDDQCKLYIGMAGLVWLAYVTSHGMVTETYFGVRYQQVLVFVDEDDHDHLTTAGNKVVAMWAPELSDEVIAWLAGVNLAQGKPSLDRNTCRQIRQDPALARILVPPIKT